MWKADQVYPIPQGVSLLEAALIEPFTIAVEAVRRGVRRTHIIDGRIPHSILIEMLTAEGIGTMFL